MQNLSYWGEHSLKVTVREKRQTLLCKSWKITWKRAFGNCGCPCRSCWASTLFFVTRACQFKSRLYSIFWRKQKRDAVLDSIERKDLTFISDIISFSCCLDILARYWVKGSFPKPEKLCKPFCITGNWLIWDPPNALAMVDAAVAANGWPMGWWREESPKIVGPDNTLWASADFHWC